MSPYKQSAGASSSKRDLNDSGDMDDMDNVNWLQQRYRELAQIYGVENVPEPSSTFWAPRHTDTQRTNGFGPDGEARVQPTPFTGRVEDLNGSSGTSAQDAYGLPPPFEGHISDTAQFGMGMGVLDGSYQLGDELPQPHTFLDANHNGLDATADLPYDFSSLSPSFFGGYVADPWAGLPGFPAGFASTSNAVPPHGPPQASTAMPDPPVFAIDPSLLQAPPRPRSTTPPVLQDIDLANQSPERPLHPTASPRTRKTKQTPTVKRERSERENVPSIIPAPPTRATRRRAPEAEEAGPARKRRRRCELEETLGTEETRCGLDGCEEVLRASDLDDARKHFNTHVEPEKTATTVKGKKGKKSKKAGKHATKQEFRCTYVEEDGKKCTHKPWTGKQALQRHVEGKHYQWSFECPVCGRVFQRRDALKRHQKPTNSRCHQPPEPEDGQDDAPA